MESIRLTVPQDRPALLDCVMRNTSLLICLSHIAILTLGSGCDRFSSQQKDATTAKPLAAFNEAVGIGQWGDAWLLTDAVREEHGDDPDVLAQLAWVAFQSEHPNESADLLMAACRLESYSREERVQQAFVAMLHVGRLFDGLDFLTDALNANPEQLGTRRLAYDLLMGLENRSEALPHGIYLVRKRKFDSELLASLCNVSRNASNDDSWAALVGLNPNDKRPLIPQAMIALGKGLHGDAITVLEEILRAHPENVQALILLGEAYVDAGQFEALETWADRLRGDYESEAGYWLTIGKWAYHRDDHAAASRAYWEATKRDPLKLEGWQGLRQELDELSLAEFQISESTIKAIDDRLEDLRNLKRTKDRFVKSRSISRALAKEISSILVSLGRLWEAEAWLAIATNLPEDPSADVVAARQDLQSQLTANTPWQLQDGHEEIQLDLSALPKFSVNWR